MAKNKELTPTQKRKRYKVGEWGFFVGEFLSAITPFVAVGIANYDKYFVEYNGTKMSIAFFMALGVMGFAIWGVAEKNIKNGYVSMLIKWAIFAFITTMLGEMIKDLSIIMWFGLIGLAGSFGLDIGKQQMRKKADAITQAMKQADQEQLVEEVKKEKTIKVKIKKD